MRNNIFGVLLFAVVALSMTVMPAYAQTDTHNINIPFNFYVDSQRLPSGQYQIANMREVGVFLIRDAKSSKVLMVKTMTSDASQAPFQSGLVFHRYGSLYFLSQVWVEPRGGALMETKREAEVRAKLGTPDEANVLAEGN